ncbi:hypothetical protein ZOSMA_5G00040 [Zostera marina]|uniref:Glutamine amidotransferase domain-containing protein n=1 Tax=Zostera marina TaxID=29655 RepID=A0A0K9NTQ7_ZOSMR|nr:hypothetical protein ZOSMA_5G00040 [Zostera marina]
MTSTSFPPSLQSSSSSVQFSSSVKVGIRNRSINFATRNVRAAASRASSVTLLDYGAGNVRSLRNAIRHIGYDIKDVQKPEDILNAERLIFPGVGAFAAAMEVLSKNGMDEALCRYIEKERPFLGICLGLQLLFETSDEHGPGLQTSLTCSRLVNDLVKFEHGFMLAEFSLLKLKLEARELEQELFFRTIR